MKKVHQLVNLRIQTAITSLLRHGNFLIPPQLDEAKTWRKKYSKEISYQLSRRVVALVYRFFQLAFRKIHPIPHY